MQLFLVAGEIPGMRFPPLLLGGTVMVAAALVMHWSPRLPAPLIGVALAGIAALVFHTHEPEVGSLHLSLPPLAGFEWSPQDVLSVIPTGLTLAFVASVNILLTSRAVEHFRGGTNIRNAPTPTRNWALTASRIWPQACSARR